MPCYSNSLGGIRTLKWQIETTARPPLLCIGSQSYRTPPHTRWFWYDSCFNPSARLSLHNLYHQVWFNIDIKNSGILPGVIFTRKFVMVSKSVDPPTNRRHKDEHIIKRVHADNASKRPLFKRLLDAKICNLLQTRHSCAKRQENWTRNLHKKTLYFNIRCEKTQSRNDVVEKQGYYDGGHHKISIFSQRTWPCYWQKLELSTISRRMLTHACGM